MLTELGKEQKFEVTYVEVEEKTDEDLTQCLVQLSTLPVAVRKHFNINKIINLVLSSYMLRSRYSLFAINQIQLGSVTRVRLDYVTILNRILKVWSLDLDFKLGLLT